MCMPHTHLPVRPKPAGAACCPSLCAPPLAAANHLPRACIRRPAVWGDPNVLGFDGSRFQTTTPAGRQLVVSAPPGLEALGTSPRLGWPRCHLRPAACGCMRWQAFGPGGQLRRSQSTQRCRLLPELTVLLCRS